MRRWDPPLTCSTPLLRRLTVLADCVKILLLRFAMHPRRAASTEPMACSTMQASTPPPSNLSPCRTRRLTNLATEQFRRSLLGVLSVALVACSVTDDTPSNVMDSTTENVDVEEDSSAALDLDVDDGDVDSQLDGSDTSIDAEDLRLDVDVDSANSLDVMDTDAAEVDICEGATWEWNHEECPEGAELGARCYIDDATCVERMGVGEGVCYCNGGTPTRLTWNCYPECQAK